MTERMRIDSSGNVGLIKQILQPNWMSMEMSKVNSLDINGAANVASLNANGPVKIGVSRYISHEDHSLYR
ncbi:MAG: hypothetical protein IPP15_15860 [Saprospiraceae bacterium]|uniref:Uncharacterized protein n=1 Tax=Candidatus Opimibacter skivensis TaxID=2982028 RepID=A0A9D7XTL0_9BACT|nr:hypothetical protein [Candidatus Opimibacter skivensis]